MSACGVKITVVTDIRDWITSGAVIAGGLWVVWTFWWTEGRRRKKEMPAITSSVSASVVRAVDGYVFVSTTSQWKNHSPKRWTPSFGQVVVTAKVESGVMIQATLLG